MSQPQGGFDNVWTRARSKRDALTLDIESRLTNGEITPPDLKDIRYGSEEYKRIYDETVSQVLKMVMDVAPYHTANREQIELEVAEWLFAVQGEQQGMLFPLDEEF